jgi:hypothetical protein
MPNFNWRSDDGLKGLKILIKRRKEGKTYQEIADEINQTLSLHVTSESLRHAYRRHYQWYINEYQSKEILEMNEQLKQAETTSIEEEIDIEKEAEETIQKAKEEARKERDRRILQKLLKERAATELIIDMFKEQIKAFEWMNINPPEPVNIIPKTEEALLLFSDAQIGENITLEDTNGIGEYNIHIFKERMDRLVKDIRELTYIHQLAHRIDTLNIFMLGDNVDGIGIYPGQVHHLDALVIDQMLIGSEKIAESLLKLLGTFKKIKITGIVGNHGRIGRKGENPSYVNFDYLLYKMLERLLINYKDRIEWHIPKSNWTLTNIGNAGFLLLHGDTIKAWNGIPYYGIDRADARLTKMLAAFGKTYQYLCLGHHHNPGDVDSPNGEKILNGTMVGGSSFSINQLHTTSRPSQWFFGVDPEKGRITWRYKILLDEE